MAAPLLEINNLHATVDGKAILNGLTLTLDLGEVAAVMRRAGTLCLTRRPTIWNGCRYWRACGNFRCG